MTNRGKKRALSLTLSLALLLGLLPTFAFAAVDAGVRVDPGEYQTSSGGAGGPNNSGGAMPTADGALAAERVYMASDGKDDSSGRAGGDALLTAYALDAHEIQFREAVAVLNRIGVVTGYEDGSFRPTGALTRGAAAKIVVSLRIGPEAAGALAAGTAPYKDVPATNALAGVISYCKTEGIINGYNDGTFRPSASLTGYAFAKMLLGALGYDGGIEHFTGSGWIMNVSRLGSAAGLFDGFDPALKGNDVLTREQACQLALNTLKATLVEYRIGSANQHHRRGGQRRRGAERHPRVRHQQQRQHQPEHREGRRCRRRRQRRLHPGVRRGALSGPAPGG